MSPHDVDPRDVDRFDDDSHDIDSDGLEIGHGATLFVHGALQALHDGDAARDERITRALTIPRQRSEWNGPRRRLRRATPIAAAALVLIGAVLFSIFATSFNPAHAAIARALMAAAELSDRHYSVTRVVGGVAASRSPASLYLRGANRFVACLNGPLGEIRLGCNGAEFWAIPAIRVAPVLVSQESRLAFNLLQETELQGPFLTVNSMLAQLSDYYELQLIDDPSGALSIIRASRSPNKPDLDWPDVVEVRSRNHDAVTIMIELKWNDDDPDRPGDSSVILELVDEEPQPDTYYEHSSHHSPRRAVRPF